MEELRASGPLPEPPQSPEQARDFSDGMTCFHHRDYWSAHERWEETWRRMGNTPQDDGEIVLRGLIQLAAALHAGSRGRRSAAVRNLAKAREKLGLCQGGFWGVDIGALCHRLDAAAGDAAALAGLVLPKKW
ncbi:MAG: DUF309 domain-containing protein [Nitrospirota bacterium]|nr:DUF309 domain-containing protein [Nitrospirota bacterium]